jgi:hypothetical protein
MSEVPLRHSFRASRSISGGRREKIPLTQGEGFSLPPGTYRPVVAFSASSLVALTGKPLPCSRTSGLSWLSYSPSGFPRTPSVVVRSGPPVARSDAPHTGHVERSLQSRTPWAGFEEAFLLADLFAPALKHDGLPRGEGISASPYSRPHLAGWDRNAGIPLHSVVCPCPTTADGTKRSITPASLP